jgi:hypothetical protein
MTNNFSHWRQPFIISFNFVCSSLPIYCYLNSVWPIMGYIFWKSVALFIVKRCEGRTGQLHSILVSIFCYFQNDPYLNTVR